MVVVIPTQVSLCGVCILPQAIMCYFHRVWLLFWLSLTVEIQFSSFGVLVIVNCKKVCVCVLSLPACLRFPLVPPLAGILQRLKQT